MRKPDRRAASLGIALFLLLAVVAGRPAFAQDASLPPDAAIEAGDAAVGRSRSRVQEAVIADAVISGIARYPGKVSAIVRAAVDRAPAHRAAIARLASHAFPGFATRIAAAAAGVAPAPSRVAASAPRLGLSELRMGFAHHDSGVFGRTEEEGVDVTLEARFAPLTGGAWDAIWRPRPHVGININSAGDTSALYLGLTWDWDVWDSFFVSLDLGAAVHDGETSTLDLTRKELGSRVLFREAVEFGYRFHERHALSLRVDHISNAKLADKNEGLDTVGIVYSYRFP